MIAPLLAPIVHWFMRLVGKEVEKKLDKPKKKKKKPADPVPKRRHKTIDEVSAESRERMKNVKRDVGPPVALDNNPYDEGGE